MNWINQVKEKLMEPKDIALAVIFRIGAGLFLSIEEFNRIIIKDHLNYIEPEMNFTYHLFPFVPMLPEWGVWLLFITIIVLGIMVALGWYYRFATIALFLCYFLLFILEKAEFVNHFYLFVLVSFFLIFVPFNRAFSLDVLRKPSIKTNVVPAWTLYLFAAHMGIVYFFGGVAKLHSDWLEHRALALWMQYKAKLWLIGPIVSKPWVPPMMSWGGLFLDLLIVPVLLFRRTRIFGLAIASAFHMTNAAIFGLATFPWFSILATTLFFPSDWPRKVPIIRLLVRGIPKPDLSLVSLQQAGYQPLRKGVLLLFVFYFSIHLFLPLRHHLYPGHVNWTEEGHMFSWHMMLRAKTGYASFQVEGVKDGDPVKLMVDPKDHLSYDQNRKMSYQPDLLLQFAHFLKEKYEKEGYHEIKVFAHSRISLNGRPAAYIVDPKADLSQYPRRWGPDPFIMPFPPEIKRGDR